MDNDESRSAPIESWSDITFQDLLLAYRKAKVDCFYERAISHAELFAKYEESLEENLQQLLSCLTADRFRSFLESDHLLGEPVLVPKKLRWDRRDQGQDNVGGHFYFSDKDRAFRRRCVTHCPVPEFRLASRFPVDLHIVSALWVNRIGHRYDACLDKSVYGSRVRRYGDDGAPKAGRYHITAPGTMPPYFLPYRRWRDDGLAALERALKEGKSVIGTTLDVANYFHRIDPSFLTHPRFLEVLRQGDPDFPGQAATLRNLSEVELEFTNAITHLLSRWAKAAEERLEPSATNTALGGIPIGLTAARVIANVLLVEWDRAIRRQVTPIFYARYVDDMFLVLADPGEVYGPDEVLDWMAKRLRVGMLQRDDGHANADIHEIVLGEYQGRSKLQLKNGKHKVFFLDGESGIDLLSTIKAEITDLSSERRLLADPACLTRSVSAGVLTAAGRAAETADTVGRAEQLTIRRMGWAIQLRGAEQLAADLPPDEWRRVRWEFYRFAKDHILRPDVLLDYIDYLPRLVMLAVATRELSRARELFDEARSALEKLLRACDPDAFQVNGVAIRKKSIDVATMLERYLKELTLDALKRAWPLPDGVATESPDGADAWFAALGVCKETLCEDVDRLRVSDFGRDPLKHWLRDVRSRASFAVAQIENVWPQRLSAISDFCVASGFGGGVGAAPSLLFPTRPLTPIEITELDWRCISEFARDSDQRTGVSGTPVEHWARMLLAIRGTRSNLGRSSESFRFGVAKTGIVELGGKAEAHVRLGIANVASSPTCWSSAAGDDPELTAQRYSTLVTFVNRVLKAKPRPTYLLLPELVLPRRWVESVENRLLDAGIGLVAGVEYRFEKGGKEVANEVVVSLPDHRLGYRAAVRVWQRKSAPSPGEREELQCKFGLTCVGTNERLVFSHNGFSFGILVCSELQNVQRRAWFQGKVDALFVLCWTRDLETFSALVDAAALDVHAYVALVNSRSYGGTRVRYPAKLHYLRDVCRLHGGEEDALAVVAVEHAELRDFQSRAMSCPRESDPFKPVPSGFTVDPHRKVVPGASLAQPDVNVAAEESVER